MVFTGVKVSAIKYSTHQAAANQSFGCFDTIHWMRLLSATPTLESSVSPIVVCRHLGDHQNVKRLLFVYPMLSAGWRPVEAILISTGMMKAQRKDMNPPFLMGICTAIARGKRKCPRCGRIQSLRSQIRKRSVTCKFCGQDVPFAGRSSSNWDIPAPSR